VIDLLKGEHYQPEYVAINPNRMVPVLEDGDFPFDREFGDSSSTSRRKTGSFGLSEGAALTGGKVNEMMDWINYAGLSRIRLRAGLPANLPEPQRGGKRRGGTRARSPGARKKAPGPG